jgi:hypothetical protein
MSMTEPHGVDDAETDDIYADVDGKLWRIISVVRQPTVIAEEVEGTLYDPYAPYAPLAYRPGHVGPSQALNQATQVLPARIDKNRRSGPIGTPTWHGWRRIFRRSMAP